MSDAAARKGRAEDGNTHQPAPPERRDRGGLEAEFQADQHRMGDRLDLGGRGLKVEAIRILPPRYVTLTGEQEARAVAMLIDLLRPLCKGSYPPDPEER